MSCPDQKKLKALNDWINPPAYRPIEAICYLYNEPGEIIGLVRLKELPNWETKIDIEVYDQCPGDHGIHIHRYADILDPSGIGPRRGTASFNSRPTNHCPGKVNPPISFKNCCQALGGHYNPYDSPHGSPQDDWTQRHIGDLGNIRVSADGRGFKVIQDRLVRLRGRFSVLNRSIILHKDADDLGRGNNPESRKTGNSGPRIACGIIKQINI